MPKQNKIKQPPSTKKKNGGWEKHEENRLYEENLNKIN